MLAAYLSGFPAFVTYFITALALTVLFISSYSMVTAHHEFRLLRSGCAAAVPAFLGALIGYVIPLTATMRASVNLTDFLIWALIAAVIQIVAYFVARLLMPDVSKRITDNDMAGGIFLGGMALTFGLLNAASLTP